MLSRFSRVQLFATPWTVTCQAPLSMGFSQQEYWSGLPFVLQYTPLCDKTRAPLSNGPFLSEADLYLHPSPSRGEGPESPQLERGVRSSQVTRPYPVQLQACPSLCSTLTLGPAHLPYSRQVLQATGRPGAPIGVLFWSLSTQRL